MRKPVIGVMPLWDEGKQSYWMLPGYVDGIVEAGGLPVMLPLVKDPADAEQLVQSCDGLLFTGGDDVDPAVYGEAPIAQLGGVCRRRDLMEKMAVDCAVREDKAVLGICRGIQIINAALGGTLYQDLPTQHGSEINHHMDSPYDRAQHEVKIAEGTPLHSLLKADTIGVNSMHHQAVKDLAPGLSAMAVAPDGIVEALYRPESRFMWAVQWHPECFFRKDENSRRIFRSFVEAAAQQG